MEIDLAHMHDRFRAAQRGKESRHTPSDRVKPSRFQYDYLTLSNLSTDVEALIRRIPQSTFGRVALDLGSDRCPYRDVLGERGFDVKTLDLSRDRGADYVGTAECTNLPDACFDLVLCTQVLEHCTEPWTAAREIARILRPGGYAIVSVPHVWFYHPHPEDNWRFTQEGVVRLLRGGGLEVKVLLSQGGSVAAAAQVLNFLVYGAMGKVGAPLYWSVNVVASLVDNMLNNPLFCVNFACLATRPEGRDVAPLATRP